MRVNLDCFPCFLRQTIIALRLGTKDELLQERILKSILPEIQIADISMPPAYTTTFIHRKIRQLLDKDPFGELKHEYNKISLGLYPSLITMVRESQNPL